MATLRGVGAFNGVLAEPTGQVIGFMRDPMKAAYLQYVQEVPAPTEGNGLFRYCVLDPDEAVRIVNLDEYAWGFDDPVPTGKNFQLRAKWGSSNTERYAFPYTLGDRTVEGWQKAGIPLKGLYDRIRLGHAMLHRAYRVVSAVRDYSWPAANTATLNALLGTTGASFGSSSGTELDPTTGVPNPNFQVIKRVQNRVMRRLDLLSNNATVGSEFVMVFGPRVAQRLAEAGEVVNYLKQQAGAKQDLMVRNGKWGIPDEYNGWKLVVEDTPRAYSRQQADGSVADVTVATQKAYVWDDDKVFFGSRPGGLDGQYGFQNFSTVQLYTYSGKAAAAGAGDQARAGVYVKAEGDAWNEVTKGAIVTEDKPLLPAASVSGFLLTGVLTAEELAVAA